MDTKKDGDTASVPVFPFSSGVMGAGGYCVWEYREKTWAVAKQACGLGYHAGDPPRGEGRFEGELLRKHCEPVLDPVEVVAAAASD